MKILLVNKFHYIKGGSETYYFGLADLLRSHGHEVIFFSMKDKRNFPCEQEKYFVENVDFNAPMSKWETAKAALKMLYSLEAKKKFDQLLKDEKPDIIHLNIFQSQLTGSIVDVAHKHQIPVVYTAHDLKCICPSYLLFNCGAICEKCLYRKYWNCVKTACMKGSKLKSLLAVFEAYSYILHGTYKKMDRVITPSLFHKKKFEASNEFSCSIQHIPNFLIDDLFFAAEPMVGTYYLYFGRLSSEKGVLTIINAYSMLQTERKLFLVGTGPLENEIKALILQTGMENRIHLLGFKQGEELISIVKNAYCVLMPSECHENGPYSIMEAMAAGKPVIVSSNGGLPELVEDGVTGYISVPGDAADLSKKMKHMDELPDEKILEMSKKSIERAKEKFDKNRYYERLITIYKELL